MIAWQRLPAIRASTRSGPRPTSLSPGSYRKSSARSATLTTWPTKPRSPRPSRLRGETTHNGGRPHDPFGHSLTAYNGINNTSEGSVMDIARGELVEKELDAMIERRSRKGGVDPDEQEELWKESVRAYTAKKREEMRAAWHEYHQGHAARLIAVLEELISSHEQQAERYRDQPKGA